MRWLLASVLVLGACGGVEREDREAASGTTSSSSGGGACSGGPSLYCAKECGTDFYDVEPICENGAWVCPPGSVNPNTCPPSCIDQPACTTCMNGTPICSPELCVSSCPEVMCPTCDGLGPMQTDTCSCACNALGQYACVPIETNCCRTSFDCGDIVYVPCVNGVCKQPVDDGCWSDDECLPFETCEGEFVCPCGADCDAEDKTGKCVPMPD